MVLTGTMIDGNHGKLILTGTMMLKSWFQFRKTKLEIGVKCLNRIGSVNTHASHHEFQDDGTITNPSKAAILGRDVQVGNKGPNGNSSHHGCSLRSVDVQKLQVDRNTVTPLFNREGKTSRIHGIKPV